MISRGATKRHATQKENAAGETPPAASLRASTASCLWRVLQTAARRVVQSATRCQWVARVGGGEGDAHLVVRWRRPVSIVHIVLVRAGVFGKRPQVLLACG